MEIKDFQYLIFAGILLFCFVFYLGYDDMKMREASGEDVFGENERKWMEWFQIKNPYSENENFEDQNNQDDQKKPDILEIDEEEDKKREKYREGKSSNPFKKIGKDIEKGITKGIIKPLTKGFKKTTDAVGKEAKKTTNTIGKGIKKTTDTIGKSLTKFFKVITKPILYIFGFVECGIHKIENIFVCFKWYLLQIIGVIMYFPYRIIFYLTGTTSIEKTLWKMVDKGDSLFYDFTGYHFAHYQDDVTNLCYKCCKQTKTSECK